MSNLVKNITESFLGAVISMADNMIRISLDRKEAYRILNNQFNKDLSPARMSGIINNLKHRGYITIKRQTEGDSIEFTDKAKLKMVDDIAKKLDWDGKYRFISFDIPEKYRFKRDGFRRTIKRLGFKKVQKSLWVSEKNVGYFVEVATRYYQIEQYIAYIVSEKSDIDRFIDKLFAKDQKID